MESGDWAKLTPDQRQAARMEAWAGAEGLEFASADAASAYRERAALLRDAVALRKPARVPVAPMMGLFPIRYAGFTARDAYYDREKLAEASRRFHEDFMVDTLQGSITMVPGDVFDILDYRMYEWPGHGIGDDSSYQYQEAEYMREHEYDAFLTDPSAFWQRLYLPRVFGALAPLQGLGPLVPFLEMPFTAPFLAKFGEPEVQQMLRTLMTAGEAARRWLQDVAAIDTEIATTFGLPDFDGGVSLAPYDMLADTMRGTRGAMLDGFRRRGQLLAAVERLVPIAIEWGVKSASGGGPFVFMPLHKGADGFMSDADFRELYWPSLKAVVVGLNEQGLVPFLFAEGSFNQRLDVIVDREIAPARTLWMFDATDMVAVRDRFDGFACFGGNVPGSLLKAGTPEEVHDYVERLLRSVAGDGGFVLSTGVVVDDARPENVKAMVEAGRRYGADV